MNKVVKKILISFMTLVILLSAYLAIDSMANSVPAEFISHGYHLYEYDIRSKVVNGETRYNITVNDLRREYAILCCQHGTALPSGDPIPEPAQAAGIDGQSIDRTMTHIGDVTNTTKDYYSQYDGLVTRTAAWYKVTEERDATPEEAYILSEMVLDTQAQESNLAYYQDENGNRETISPSDLDSTLEYNIGGERYFLYNVEYAVQTTDGAYVVEYAGYDEATGKNYYKFKTKENGDYVKYNGDLTMADPEFSMEEGSTYMDLDAFEYSFENSEDSDGIVLDGRVYITSNEAAKYDEETDEFYRAYATDGTYYVQQAWWASEANIGTKVAPNGLSKEAKAFEQYILRVTRSRTVAEVMSKYVDHAYEIEFNGTVYSGTVPAAPIDYNARYMNREEVANILNVDIEELSDENEYGISVVFDENTQKFRIGPIVMDYVEERVHIEGRNPIEFAGITDMTLHTNLGEVPKDKWSIVFLDDFRSDDDEYGYPHEQEPFYIEMDYIEGAIEITDLHTTFRYMNAGGKWEKLEGVYNKITWESAYKANRCSGPGPDPDPDDDVIPTCSHGYTGSHIIDYTSWLNIIKVVPTDSQLLASGLIGVRWYDPFEIHLGVELGPDEPEQYEAKIQIKKVLENGDNSYPDEFKFEVYIDGSLDDTLYVKPNETVYTKTYKWEEGESAPSYEIKEVDDPNDEFTIVGIENATGTLQDGVTAQVIATNRVEEESGSLHLIKIAEGDNLQDKVYKFKVTIGNDVYDNVEISQATGWTWDSETYTWTGNNAPKFRVEEVDPEILYPGSGIVIHSILPATGTLADKNDNNQVVVTAINTEKEEEYESGKVSVTKKVDGNIQTNETFSVTIEISNLPDGSTVKYPVTLAAGQTYTTPEIKWKKGTAAPTFKVIEEDIPAGWSLVDIQNAQGSLANGETAKVVVINEASDEHVGNIKVTKECITDEKMQDEAQDGEFTVTVRVSGTFEVDGESIVNGSKSYTEVLKAGESFETPDFKWYGNTAPTYTVTESNIPEGWTLDGITNSSGSLQPDTTVKSIVTNSFSTRIVIDLTIELGGIVWEDGLEDTKLVEGAGGTGEGKYADGIYDASTEDGIGNVEVFVEKVLYSEAGNEVGRTYASIYTEDGVPMELPIYTSIEDLGRWKAPRVELGVTEAEKAQGASFARMNIRFRYDGQTYEPTKELVTGSAEDYIFASTANRDRWKYNSMALDIDRQEVNNRVAEVFGGNEAAGNRTDGYVQGLDGAQNNISYVTTPGNAAEDAVAKSEVLTLHDNGMVIDVFKANATTEKAGLVYPFDDRVHLLSWDKYIDEFGAVEEYHYTATYEYTKNINLGLKKRPTSDLAVAKDLNKAVVVANGKMITYRYNSILGDLSQGAQVAIESKNTVNGYKVSVYDTDYYYRAAIYEGTDAGAALDAFYASIGKEAEDSELEVYLNYRILVLNNSQGNYVAEVREIADYFDESLILVENEETAYIQTEVDGVMYDGVETVAVPSTYTLSNGATGNVTWSADTSNIPAPQGAQKAYKTSSLTGVKLARGEYAILDVTFRLDKGTDADGVENAIKLGDKNNIAEIARYSIYGEDGVTVEGKIDLNSAPANINFDENYFEDDTDKAPVVTVGMYETQREIEGLVFEDDQTESLGDAGYDQVVGDGIYEEDDDQAIGSVTTELVEKVIVPTDASYTNYQEFDVIWPTESTEIDGLGGNSIETLTGFDSTIKTVEDGTYKFTAVPAGNFAVRYTYGKEDASVSPIDERIAIYNGQDFKTTAYQAVEDTSYVPENGIINNEWHDFSIGAGEDGEVTKYNDARDLETRRLEVITKSRVLENVNSEVLASANTNAPDEIKAYKQKLYDEYYMVAETAKLNLEVEDITSEMVQRVMDGESVKLNGIEMNGKVIKDNPTAEENELYNTAIVYTFGDIDCGIEARSSTGIALDKQISNITLALSDRTELVNVNFDIEYEKDLQRDGSYRFKAKVKKASGGVGSEQLQAVNKRENKFEDTPSGYQNFRYLNVDEVIMQGATLSIKYQITALNVGEVDRVGELADIVAIEDINAVIDEIKAKQTSYAKNQRYNEVGRYLGSVYYNGANAKGNDAVVATKVNQVIDYVDNDAVFAAANNMNLDNSWKQVSEKELLGIVGVTEVDTTYPDRIISNRIFTEDATGNLKIYDPNNKAYNSYASDGISLQKGNIVLSVENEEAGNTFTNKGFMTETRPMGYDEDDSIYKTQIDLLVTRTISSENDVDDLSFDNLAEVVKFENEVGRRDIIAIPGNADPKLGEFTTSLYERDQSATEVVTLTPPTGINVFGFISVQVLLTVLVALVILAVGIVIIKKKVLTK